MKLADRLISAREEKNLSQEALAHLVGVKQQTIQAIESGKTKQPRLLDKIAKVLETTPQYLQFGITNSLSPIASRQNGYDNDTIVTSPVNIVQIPILELGEVEDWINGNLSVPNRSIKMYFKENSVGKTTLFAIQAQGDAMEAANRLSIYDGDYVVFDKDLKPANKDIVLAKVQGKRTIRQFIQDGEDMILKPLNTQYAPQPIEDASCILAVSVSTYRDLKL